MTERVTIQYNGEMVTVDVPDGTTDEQIRQHLAGQEKTPKSELTTAPTDLSTPASVLGAQSAVPYAVSGVPNMTNVPPPGLTGPVVPGATKMPGAIPFVAQDAYNVGKTIANNATINSVLDVAKKHGLTGSVAEFGKAVLHPFADTTLTQAAKNLGGGLAYGMAAPENVFSAPYQMSAYEQEKIRANPNAPEYKTNPYAQQFRGEAPTQGAAGVANTRNALINQPYGGLNPEQQQMLQQDRQRQLDIQKKQQKKQQAQMILQQPPTAQNFIQRMTAMSDLYGDANQG
jgi:hypothetical protein